MRVGEPERSWRRDYDDGSAGNAAKYDDARADNDDYTAATTTAAATTTITNCPTSQTTILMASVVLKCALAHASPARSGCDLNLMSISHST